MRIKIGQLFVRGLTNLVSKNTYLVCGIIKTDEPLETESTYILTADMVNIIETHDVRMYSRGNSLDGVAQSPIWKINIKD